MLFKVLFILFSMCTLQISAQTTIPQRALTQEQFIQGVATYRAAVIQNVKDVLLEFYSLCDSIMLESRYPVSIDTFRSMFIDELVNNRFKSIGEIIDDIYPYKAGNRHKKIFKNWAHDRIYELYELNTLAGSFLIEPEPPFKLADLNETWKEYQLLDIEAGQTILDLGGGTGLMSFILASSLLPLDIYITEIDTTLLPYLNKKRSVFDRERDEVSIQIIKGQEEDIGVVVAADRIILREVFHHFSAPEAMLRSIHSSLVSDGQLILIEGTIEAGKEKPRRTAICTKAMHCKDIIEQVELQGFRLISKHYVNENHVLKFRRT